MTRYIKRGGKVWIKIFPDKPVTAKPAETRMGSGKGALEYWVAVVKAWPRYVRDRRCSRGSSPAKHYVLLCTNCPVSARSFLEQT